MQILTLCLTALASFVTLFLIAKVIGHLSCFSRRKNGAFSLSLLGLGRILCETCQKHFKRQLGHLEYRQTVCTSGQLLVGYGKWCDWTRND